MRAPAPPILVWGAGAMGGSIGGSLLRRGQEVLFVDRDAEHVRALNERGLEIRGPVEAFTVRASALEPDEVEGVFPLILLCVKAHHTGAAVAELEPHLSPGGTVVSIQNGLCEYAIAERVGMDRTLGAFVNFGADYLEPGVVHRGNRGAVVVGEVGGRLSDRAREVHQLLRLFEPRAVLTSNILGFLWGKLAYAALLFATALTDDPIADVLERASWRPLLVALAREVLRTAEAVGVHAEAFDGFQPGAFAPGASASASNRSLDALVAFNRASAKTHSGIWRDLAVRKRPTEVDAQLGTVVRMAGEVKVSTPLLQALIQQIHEIERGMRVRGWENLEELRELAEMASSLE